MAESWEQKKVDIVHWLQGVRPKSPEPSKESDRELTSSSDIFTTEQVSLSPPLTTPISSHTRSNLPDNTHKPSPVLEPAACVSIQPSLTSAPPSSSVPDKLPSPKSLAHESTTSPPGNSPKDPRKSRSPLPLATPEPKLPTFTAFDDDGDFSDEKSNQLDWKTVNMKVNRPPNNPMKYFGRASTFPENVISHSSTNIRKGSSPMAFNTAMVLLRPCNIHSLSVNSDLINSRRKSLSQDDISQLVKKERRVSVERRCSDSELKQTDSEELTHASDGGSQSSTGACGLGSDLSGSSSTDRDVSNGASPGTLKRKLFGVLSAGSMDVLTLRLRERELEMGVLSPDEENISLDPPTHLLSPTSPVLLRQSRLSHSPSPTPPTSPYHTPIVPLGVHSETTHPKLVRAAGKSESGISKSRLRQFNLSQQFSFDTTNDEDFSTPSRHPKFLKNNVSVLSKAHSMTHSRSHSDVSSIPSSSCSNPRSSSNSREVFIERNPEDKDKVMRQCMSQLELRSTSRQGSDTEGGKTVSVLIEQLQSRRAQTSRKASGESAKNKLFRQDSGLGTLSTVSQRF